MNEFVVFCYNVRYNIEYISKWNKKKKKWFSYILVYGIYTYIIVCEFMSNAKLVNIIFYCPTAQWRYLLLVIVGDVDVNWIWLHTMEAKKKIYKETRKRTGKKTRIKRKSNNLKDGTCILCIEKCNLGRKPSVNRGLIK